MASLAPSIEMAGTTLWMPPSGPRRRLDGAQRAFDILISLLILVPALPAMAVALVIVKLTSRGPGIYTQTRLGRFGRPFQIYKIRTMAADCERQTGARWSTKGDPRVTWIGRILRKTHVDELPQLVNILRGQMSLVGPRPERPEFVTVLEELLPRYRDRLAVRPGLAGLAQVQLPPDSDIDSVRRKLRYDLHYVVTGTVWMDFRLLVATAFHLTGLPFAVSRVLLGLPGEPEVEPERLAEQSGPASSAETTVHPILPMTQVHPVLPSTALCQEPTRVA
jgi:lipopolysaccharide/colanic/teichoic acid biosynthesis glycosyltransferase